MLTYSHHQKVSLFPSANSSDNPANDSESPKAPSTIFNLYYTVLYTTLYEPDSTLNYPIQLYTQLQLIIRYQSLVCDKVDALTAQSVQPQGSQLPKVGG